MAHESFEDTEVANFLNEHFVSIKVDREERPDVDSIYMSVCQALTGEGGWPLTIVMTAEKHPFFAGTYFPKNKKYGRLGLIDLLQRLVHEWENNRGRLETTGQRIVEAIQSHYGNQAQDAAVTEGIIHEAFQSLVAEFDEEYGGFGAAPKFPTPHNLSFLLRYHQLTGEPDALHVATRTLDAMREGGIWDHVGWGFARYSVDRMWRVPHFEKMLYDNALLAIAFLEAYQVTEDGRHAETARQIFHYVEREMTSPEGGFYSALDADSEGEEGKFYAWDADEIRMVLTDSIGESAAARVCEFFGVTDYGNFDGRNVLNTIHRDKSAFCQKHNLSEPAFDAELDQAREQLFQVREARIHPHKDDKVLRSWNGLMIAALAKGAQVLGDESYALAASKAANFILSRLRNAEGRLLARYRDGESAILAYLDDYAFLTWGLVELYEATFDEQYLVSALALTKEMMRLFHDAERGGFFLTGSDSEQLMARPKEVYDGAQPSGNSVATMNLFRLGRLTGDTTLEDLARESLLGFLGQVERFPSAHTQFLMALMYEVFPGQEIVVVGHKHDNLFQQMIDTVRSRLLPTSVIIGRDLDRSTKPVISYVSDYEMVGGRATAYVCQNFACQAPTNDLSTLERLLDANSEPHG